MRKTIFVTLPFGLAIRNFLFTGVLDRLVSEGDSRVIVFTPVPDLAEWYPNTSEHLIFEPLPLRQRYSMTGLLNHMINLRFKSINDDPTVTSVRIKRRWLRRVKRRQYLFETMLSQPLPKNKTLFRLLSAFHRRRSVVSKAIPELFEQYRPSLVFATNPIAMPEFEFLKYAKQTGVPTVGMIHSWDDLTTEGHIVMPPDRYIVWNQVMKSELTGIHGISEDQISISGIPQFDLYAEPVSSDGRDDFLRGQGLDPGKPTVLFASSPPGDTPEEPEILEKLVSVLNREYSENIQFLVRIHRMDHLWRYDSVKAPNVKFQVPGGQMASLEDKRLMERGDMGLLRDTLVYSDVVINTASTISIDAAALDRPVVNISFDIQEKEYIHSVRRFFDMIHYKAFAGSRASKVAGSFDEMVTQIQRYLENPELEKEERTSLCEAMCYKVDGNSAERISTILLETMNGEIAADQVVAAKA